MAPSGYRKEFHNTLGPRVLSLDFLSEFDFGWASKLDSSDGTLVLAKKI